MQKLLFEWMIPLTAAGSAVTLLFFLLLLLGRRILSARWKLYGLCVALAFFLLPVSLPAAVCPEPDFVPEFVEWTAAFFSQEQVAQVAASSEPTFSLYALATGVWLAGMAVLILLRLAAAFRFSRLLRERCAPETDPRLLVLYARCRESLGVRQKAMLLRCDAPISPMLWGVFRPCILLPVATLTPEQLELVLRHELIHLRRKDLWCKLAALTVNTFHWFNPLSWLLLQKLNSLCELACDESLVRGMDTNERKRYGDAILSVAGRRPLAPPVSTAFSQPYRQLKRRLLYMLNPLKPSRVMLCAAICATALLVYTGVSISSFALADPPAVRQNPVVPASSATTQLQADPKPPADPKSQADPKLQADPKPQTGLTAGSKPDAGSKPQTVTL